MVIIQYTNNLHSNNHIRPVLSSTVQNNVSFSHNAPETLMSLSQSIKCVCNNSPIMPNFVCSYKYVYPQLLPNISHANSSTLHLNMQSSGVPYVGVGFQNCMPSAFNANFNPFRNILENTAGTGIGHAANFLIKKDINSKQNLISSDVPTKFYGWVKNM